PAIIATAPTTPPAPKIEEKKPEPPKTAEKKPEPPKLPATVGPNATIDPKLKTGQEKLEPQRSPTATAPTKQATTGTPETKEEVLPKKDPNQKLAELTPAPEKKPPQKPITGTRNDKQQVLRQKKPAPQSTPRLAQRSLPPKPEVKQPRPTDSQAEMKRRHIRTVEPHAPRSSLGVKPTRSVEVGRWYVVKEGDTLTEIAARELGDPRKYRAIWKANRNRIDDPDVIRKGLRLRLP
ncbi:MAG: LysM peptidoglycan-binding domain-containing protein, partial [Hyphomicrobiaceae bacterium]